MFNIIFTHHSTSLFIRETQVKTTRRYYYIPVRMAKIKKMVITPNAGKDVEKLDHSPIASGKVKWHSHSGR